MFIRNSTCALAGECGSIAKEWLEGGLGDAALARKLTHLNFDDRLDATVRIEMVELADLIEDIGPDLELYFDQQRARLAIDEFLTAFVAASRRT